jgi:hypothetical protein
MSKRKTPPDAVEDDAGDDANPLRRSASFRMFLPANVMYTTSTTTVAWDRSAIRHAIAPLADIETDDSDDTVATEIMGCPPSSPGRTQCGDDDDDPQQPNQRGPPTLSDSDEPDNFVLAMGHSHNGAGYGPNTRGSPAPLSDSDDPDMPDLLHNDPDMPVLLDCDDPDNFVPHRMMLRGHTHTEIDAIASAVTADTTVAAAVAAYCAAYWYWCFGPRS